MEKEENKEIVKEKGSEAKRTARESERGRVTVHEEAGMSDREEWNSGEMGATLRVTTLSSISTFCTSKRRKNDGARFQ